jgi:hypothetical protein
MIVCNQENFRITRDLGFTIQGLKAQHRRKIQRIEPGDRILYYVYGIRRFAATATATSSYFEDSSPIWQNEGSSDWPYRLRIKPEVVLEEHQYIDANQLAPRLEYIRRWPPEEWYLAFQGNLHLLPKGDFLLIEEEMKKLKFGRDYKREAPAQPQATPQERSARPRRRRPATAASAPSGPTQAA